jgi:copper resistance protein B
MSPLRLGDQHNFSLLVADRLESVVTGDRPSATYDLHAWFGRDYNRAVFKAEGTLYDGKLEDAKTELLWEHALTAYWDTQLGVRYDTGEGPERTWMAFGIRGLAPYWFDVDATGYVGEEGRTAFNLKAMYELLLTQKLISQLRVEVDWYGRSDAERRIGSGLSEATAGLRLRYEIRREFAPYVGIERARKFGRTKDHARATGEDPRETRFVAGLRFWF